MATPEQQKKMAEKKQQRKIKHEKQEHLVNWYMINMCWGIFAIILLKFIDNGYLSGSTVGIMNPFMWTVTGVLAAGAVAVFILGKIGIIKNSKRANNYTVFLGISAIGSALVVLYPQIRTALMPMIPALSSVHSSWRVYWMMLAIVLYLLIALVYYFVKSHSIKVKG